MPFEFNWYDDEQTIIRLDIVGDVTWDGWYKAMDGIFAELNQSSHRIDIVLYDKSGMPKGNPMPHVKNTMRKFEQYETLGKVIIVNAKKRSAFAKVVLDVVMRAMSITGDRHGTFVNTLEEAITIIEKDRQAQEEIINSK